MGSKVLYAWQVVLSCPSICPPLSAIATMAPLPSEDITPGMEEQIKELLESYRPVRQWTVRSETTKDKAGALPPAVYIVQPTGNVSEERLRFPEENNVSSANAVPQRVVSIQFEEKGDVTEVFEDHREVQIDEYERDSDDEESDYQELLESRAGQPSVCNTIRQGCSCICASRLLMVSSNDSCLYDARDDLSKL